MRFKLSLLTRYHFTVIKILKFLLAFLLWKKIISEFFSYTISIDPSTFPLLVFPHFFSNL